MERPMESGCAIDQGMQLILDSLLTDEAKAKLKTIKDEKEKAV